MKRIAYLLLVLAPFPLNAHAGNPEKENRLQTGAVVYAFDSVWWSLSSRDAHLFPFEAFECKGDVCRITVPACEPLYVSQPQLKNSTWVLPMDEKVRSGLIVLTATGIASREHSLRGGWAPDTSRNWSPSRDECLAKIKKLASSPAPEKPAEPAPQEKPPTF